MNADNKLSLHAKAVNLARRWSVQNENDLLQENLYEDTMQIGRNVEYTHDYCEELSKHLIHLNALPAECMKFKDITSDLKRRDSDTTHPTQFLS